MKLQDYIHLYIGCDVQRDHGGIIEHGKLVGVSASEVEPGKTVTIINVGLDHFHEWYVEETVLILRPLSDITEEEQDYVWHATEPIGVFEMTFGTQCRKVVLCPDRTKFLLSKGFDLFGLINEGLAVSKNSN